ncbi:MAG: RcnB family protein [Burkholderiales bacterium]|nr:RcnB family protein [Burkholderiales bacterium]
MKSIATLCAVAIAATSLSGVAAARDFREEREDRRETREDRREERRTEREVRRETRRDNGNTNVVRVRPGVHAGFQQVQPRTGNYVYTQPVYTQPRSNYYYNDSYYNNSYYPAPAPRYSYNYVQPSYYIGGYVPSTYRQHNYYVNDWQGYGLYQPPYGHQWVRTDTGDYLLMALATGIIASLILNAR